MVVKCHYERAAFGVDRLADRSALRPTGFVARPPRSRRLHRREHRGRRIGDLGRRLPVGYANAGQRCEAADRRARERALLAPSKRQADERTSREIGVRVLG